MTEPTNNPHYYGNSNPEEYLTTPTKEEIQKFWEWCGFSYEKPICDCGLCLKNCYIAPDAKKRYLHNNYLEHTCLPPLDLNNLFKYAVPKLLYANIIYSKEQGCYTSEVSLKFADVHMWAGKDPALALFWAIMEAIK